MSKWESTGYEPMDGPEYVCPECGCHINVPENYDLPGECPECGIEMYE